MRAKARIAGLLVMTGGVALLGHTQEDPRKPSTVRVLQLPRALEVHLYVQRTDYLREDYGDDYIAPECQDAEGTKSIVPVEFDIESTRAAGKLSPAQLKQEIERRFREGIYHSPARPGIAYMLCPVVRLYAGPGSKQTVTMNMPRYMLFMPNLRATEIGAGPVMGPYPYFINPGPMAYLILNVGQTEKTQINSDSSELLKEACAYRADLCIKGVTPRR